MTDKGCLPTWLIEKRGAPRRQRYLQGQAQHQSNRSFGGPPVVALEVVGVAQTTAVSEKDIAIRRLLVLQRELGLVDKDAAEVAVERAFQEHLGSRAGCQLQSASCTSDK